MVVMRRSFVAASIAAVWLLAAAPLAVQQASAPTTVDVLAQEFSAHQSGAFQAPGALESERDVQADAAWADAFLARLHRIDQTSLSHQDWLTYATLEYDASLVKDFAPFFWLSIPVTPYASPLRTVGTTFATLPLDSDAHLQAYLDALNALPATFAAYEARLRSQAQRGIELPAAEIPLVLSFIRGFGAPPASSPFMPDEKRVSAVDASRREQFVAQVNATLTDAVIPAVERLADYVDGPYRAAAPTRVGLSQYPRGREYYTFLIRRHVGLDLTPAQIHQIGADEVERLEKALDQVRQQAGFTGTLAEFHDYLRNDSRFRARSADDIGTRMLAAIRRIEPKVDQYFPLKPKAPYGVHELDPRLAASMTYGYYQVPTSADPSGYYMFNGTRPEERSILMAEATIYHELVPGHHFQIALQNENQRLTPYRRSAFPTAFIEGWGEYASDLAGEMGMYADPYQRAGRLAMDLFVSSRLVVDTGMNALGWPREKAIAFMREHTFESDLQLDTETLRYSSDIPGQALAYKLGARHIHELRDRVAAEQGTSFDLRAFHGYLLASGAMPMPVLDGHIACYGHERHAAR
jgi:uncharacterized protein (DUF885 family)